VKCVWVAVTNMSICLSSRARCWRLCPAVQTKLNRLNLLSHTRCLHTSWGLQLQGSKYNHASTDNWSVRVSGINWSLLGTLLTCKLSQMLNTMHLGTGMSIIVNLWLLRVIQLLLWISCFAIKACNDSHSGSPRSTDPLLGRTPSAGLGD